MHALMRYTVKPDHLHAHLELLRAVYDELADTRPDGIAWATYQVADTSTFVEFVEGPELPSPLPQLSAFRRYRIGLDERCEGELEFLELHEIGSFRPAPDATTRR